MKSEVEDPVEGFDRAGSELVQPVAGLEARMSVSAWVVCLKACGLDF